MSRHGNAALSEDPRSTRDLILDVAEHRFAEKGFPGVSMRAISADTGLKNQASLYHHFRNKRALYEAVLGRGVERIVALVAESGKSEASRDAVLDRVVEYLLEHPHLPRLIQRAGVDDSRYLTKAVTRLLYPLYAQGVRVLSGRGRAWTPEEIPHLAAGLYHIIFGYFASVSLLEAVLQENLRSPAAVARQRRFLKKAMARLLDGGTRSTRLSKIVRPVRRS